VKGKRKILTPSREKSVINWTWLTELNWTACCSVFLTRQS
jgi:hypothetical protein